MLVNGKGKSLASSANVPTTGAGLALHSLSDHSVKEEINNDLTLRDDSSMADFSSYLDSPSRQVPAQPHPGQLFGPFIEPLQWLKVRNTLNNPGLFTTEQLLSEFSYLEPDMLRLFTAVQMADCPEQQNTEIILKNNKFYFRVLNFETDENGGTKSIPLAHSLNNVKKQNNDSNDLSKSNGLNNDADGDSSLPESEIAEDLCKYDQTKLKSRRTSKSQINEDGFLTNAINNSSDVPSPSSINTASSLALYAWFNDELSQKLPTPSVNCLNGVRRYFCALCNQVFANPNPVVLHILFSCPCREQLLPNGVATSKCNASLSSLSSSSISSASSSSPISTLSSSNTPSLTFPYMNHLPNPVSSPLLTSSSTNATAISCTSLPSFLVTSSGHSSINSSAAQSNSDCTITPSLSSCSAILSNSSSGASSSTFTSPLPPPPVRAEDSRLPINYSLGNSTQRNSPKSSSKKRAFDIDSLVNVGQSETAHTSAPVSAARTPTPKKTVSRSSKNNNKDDSTSARCSAFKPKQSESSVSSFNSSVTAATNPVSLNPLLNSLSHLPPYSAFDPTSFAAAAAAASKDAKAIATNPFFNSAAFGALGGSQFELAALYAHQQRQLLQCLMPGLPLPSQPPSSIANTISSAISPVTSVSQSSQAAAAAAAAAAAYSPLSPFLQPHSIAAGLAGLPGVNGNVNPGLSSLHGLAGLNSLHGLANPSALGNLSALNSLSGLNNGLNNAFYAFNNLLPSNVMTGLAALGQQSPLTANSIFGTVSSTSSTPSTSVTTANSTSALPVEKPPPKKKKAKEPKDHNNNSNNSLANNSQTNKNSVLTAALTSGLGSGAFANDLTTCDPSAIAQTNLHSPDAKQMNSSSLFNFLPPALAALSYPQTNYCSTCKQEFRMTSDLVYHIRSYHKEFANCGITDNTTSKKKREDNKLRCKICNEGFRERHHLTRHMTSHN